MNRAGIIVLGLAAICGLTDILAQETFRADHPKAVDHQLISTVDLAKLQAPVRQQAEDDLLYRGLHPSKAAVKYTQREAAIQIANIWHIQVKP